MEQKLVMNCGKFRIVAEIYPNNGTNIPPEMCVYLEDQEGKWVQDICLVRKHSQYDAKTMQFKTYDNLLDLLIWGDSDSEDYTHHQMIAIHDFEEDEDS